MASSALRATGAVLGGTTAIAVHAFRYGNWIVDDAAITFAYARSIASGDGPVLQPDAAPVEAYSNPTWLVLLSFGRLIGLFDHGTIFGIPDQVLYPKALALLCCAGILVACYRAAAAVTKKPALVTLIAGLALAAIPSFVIWCFSGLENSLFALAVAWLAAILCRAAVEDRLSSPRVAVTAGLLAAVAALTRPDGLVYAAAFPLLAVLWLPFGQAVRRSLIAVGAFAVPYGAYVAYRILEFGELVSGPAIAKSQGLPELETLMRPAELVEYAGALTVLVIVACVGFVLSQPSPLRTGMTALLVPLGLAIVAHAVLMPDWMGEQRFSTPVWPLTALVGTLAVGAALTRLAPRGRAVLAIGLVVALVPTLSAFRTASDKFRADPTVPMCYIADRFGDVFDGYAERLGIEHGTVLIPDVGGSALAGRMKIVDWAGLAEYDIARFRGDENPKGLHDYIFEDVRPTFLHTHEPWGWGVTDDPRLARDYLPLFQASHNDGDWVRRDAVDLGGGGTQGSPGLASARAYAARAVPTAVARNQDSPRRQCVDTFAP
jgi:hypothetical protein